MIRLTILTVALVSFTPLSPMGCPPTSPDEDPEELLARGSLETFAEAPKTAVAGTTVPLRASVAAADDDDTVRYSWLQIDGPGVSIDNAESSAASFEAPSLATARVLVFMVTTRNASEDVGAAEVSVTVAADPDYGQGGAVAGAPVSNPGIDRAALPGDVVTLSGTGSTGADLTYRWRQVSGPPVTLSDASSVKATFVVPAYDASNRTLVFDLTVTGANNRMSTARTEVAIRNPDAARVRVTTSRGNFTIELDEDSAPITVANFLQYVDDGFYDGTIFHRVIPDFVVQGGGLTPDLEEKETGDPIASEADNGLSNVRGTVALARTADPDSARAQFFVNVADNIAGGDGLSDLDPGGVSIDGYAVFGRVIAGMSVADAIAAVETESRGGLNDVPVEDVVIESIERVAGN